MKYVLFCFFLAFVCHVNLLFGQADGKASIDLSDRNKRSSFHIQTFPNKNHLLLTTGAKLIEFKFFPLSEKTNPIETKPNPPAFIGLGANLFDLDVIINMNLVTSDQKQNILGVTTGFFFYTRIFTNHFMYDLKIKFLKGFYIPKNNNFLKNNDIIKLTNTELDNISGKVTYIFSPHKYVSGMGQRFDIRQLHSAGSFSLMSGIGRYAANGFNELAEHLPLEKYNISVGDLPLNQNYLSLQGGYGYNLVVKKKFIAHAKGAIGFAYQFSAEDYSKSNVGGQLGYELSIVYDNGGWFGSVRFQEDGDFFDGGSHIVFFSSKYFSLTFGRRFLKRGLLSKYSIFDLIPWYNKNK